MGKYCIVYGCCSRTPDPDVSFHVLPRNPVLRLKWIANIPRTRKILELSSKAHVCSLHFEESNFRFTKRGVRTLNDGAAPTIFNSQTLALRTVKSRKRTYEAHENWNNVLSPVNDLLKEKNITSHQDPVKLLLEDQMIASFKDVNGTMVYERSLITSAGTSSPKKKPAFEAVHRIDIKTLLQHFHEHVGDSTMASNDGSKKNVLFIRGGKELFAAVVEKSKNSSPCGASFIRDKDGGMWKTKHILRINCKPGKIIIKNADVIAKIEDPSGVFSSSVEKTVSMMDDQAYGTAPSPTDNSEKCVDLINQKEYEVHQIKSFAEKEQMLGEMNVVSSSEQACRKDQMLGEMNVVSSSEQACRKDQMLGKSDVSSSKHTISSPTKAGKLVIKNADLIATFEHLNHEFPSAAEETVSSKDDKISSAAPSPTHNSEKSVSTSPSQKDEEAHCMRTSVEEEQMLGRKDVSRSEEANSSPAKIWELRFECDSCKGNNEIVFMKPFKIATKFTIFLCPTEECIYPLWVKHLHRFIFQNLPDEMLLACSPDDAPTVHDIVSIIKQSSPQNTSSPMSVP